MAPGYSPLAAGAWIPLLTGLHLVLPAIAGASALLPVLAWGVFLAGDQGTGNLAKAVTLLVVWLSSAGEASFHRRTRWRLLALLGPLQVLGIEKVRTLLAGDLFLLFGRDTWAAAFHSDPLCLPLARWLGPSAATLALVLPQFLLVACYLRLTRAAPPAPAQETARGAWLRRRAGPWMGPGLAVLLMAVLLVSWLFPGPAVRPASGSITVAVVQPGWTHRTHPAIRQALQAGDARRVAAVLLEEAENAARRAGERGARLVLWPLDYLNFDPLTEPTGRERLLTLARHIGAVLVLPFGFWTPDGPAHGVAVVHPDSPGTAPGGRLWSVTRVGREGVTFPLDGRRVTFLPLIREPAQPSPPPPVPGAAAPPPGATPPGGTAAPGPLGRVRARLLGPTFAPAGSTLILTAAPAGFSPLGLAPAAAAAGASLVHGGWGVAYPAGPARDRLRGPEGISLIADTSRWRTTASRPGTVLLLAQVSPGPGPGPLGRADPLGWLGVLSLPAAALYRRRPRPPGPSPSGRQ
ncbi:MAG: hypothetical protein QME87_00710 [Bacillota bacterium]|nr:hypothetical protein [Bacillota bacterium]